MFVSYDPMKRKEATYHLVILTISFVFFSFVFWSTKLLLGPLYLTKAEKAMLKNKKLGLYVKQSVGG